MSVNHVYTYDFSKGGEGNYEKFWVLWTGSEFNETGKAATIQLKDGEEFHIRLAKPKSGFFPTKIDTLNVRLHNVSCPNLDRKKYDVAIGHLDTFIVTVKDGKEVSRKRIVPTDTQDRNNTPFLPPYWIALPAMDWGTFVIPIIDYYGATGELMKPNKRLAFQWHGKAGGPVDRKTKKSVLPIFKAKSLELYIICK